MIVVPQYQNMGFGSMLLNGALKFIEAKDGSNSLFSVSLFSNVNAVDFYINRNFMTSTEIPLKLYFSKGKRGSRKDVSE